MFEKRALTFCQNLLLSKTELTARFANCSFFAFFKRLTQKFICFLYSFWDVFVLSRKNLFGSLELISKSRKPLSNRNFFLIAFYFRVRAFLLMVVGESMMEFVIKYALSFRLWKSVFRKLPGLYFKWEWKSLWWSRFLFLGCDGVCF